MEWNDPSSYVICGKKESINFPQNDHHDKMGLKKALTLCDFYYSKQWREKHWNVCIVSSRLIKFRLYQVRFGEGNGNPLQCSCLENPRDGGAWWAAVSEVAQSQTWLKRLSSSRQDFLSKSVTGSSKPHGPPHYWLLHEWFCPDSPSLNCHVIFPLSWLPTTAEF